MFTTPAGTIPGADLHGYNRVKRPSPVAEASGLPDLGSRPAFWLLGLVGVLLAIRFVWERAEKAR